MTGPGPAKGLPVLYAGWADALERDLAILTVATAGAGDVGWVVFERFMGRLCSSGCCGAWLPLRLKVGTMLIPSTLRGIVLLRERTLLVAGEHEEETR